MLFIFNLTSLTSSSIFLGLNFYVRKLPKGLAHSTRFQTITLKDERRVTTVEKSINNIGGENPEQQGTPENLEVSLICS